MKTIIFGEVIEYESDSDLQEKLKELHSNELSRFMDALNSEKNPEEKEFVKIESKFVGEEVVNSKNDIIPSSHPGFLGAHTEHMDGYNGIYPNTDKPREIQINDSSDESESDGNPDL